LTLYGALAKFWNNPQYQFSVASHKSSQVVVSILQKTNRNTDNQQIGFYLFQVRLVTLLRYGCGVLWSTSLSVCLSVSPRAYLWYRWTDLHEIFCADPLWPWLGPPLAALRCLYRLYEWRHVWS